MAVALPVPARNSILIALVSTGSATVELTSTACRTGASTGNRRCSTCCRYSAPEGPNTLQSSVKSMTSVVYKTIARAAKVARAQQKGVASRLSICRGIRRERDAEQHDCSGLRRAKHSAGIKRGQKGVSGIKRGQKGVSDIKRGQKGVSGCSATARRCCQSESWQCFVVLRDALVFKVGVSHEIEMAKALSIGGEHACRAAS